MGASGYLAAKSEGEVAARQEALEREEIRLMPDIEEDELALIYESKGLHPTRARELAKELMRDPESALSVKMHDKLGIQPPGVSPLAEGVTTGLATAIGALIPLVPFLALSSDVALWTSFGVSMASHFLVGAARSLYTARGFWRSGRDMFVVGFGVALVAYLVGHAFEGL